MITKYSLFTFIIIASYNLFHFNVYGSPAGYTLSDPLTPLDPVGNHLNDRLEPLHRMNGISVHQSRNGNTISSRVMDTYKRNLDEAMGKKTSTTTSSIPTKKPNDKIKTTSTDKLLKTETSTDIKKTEVSSEKAITNPTNPKLDQKIEHQKTDNQKITPNEEKYQKQTTSSDKIEKKSEKEDQKALEKANTNKDASATLYDQKNFKKDARKQAYDGARPQLWYGGPWNRG